MLKVINVYLFIFSPEWKQIETWKVLEKTWLSFRLGEAKWQHFPTRWMLVTWSSRSSVFDTEMATFKNSAWLSDSSTCVAWNPSKSINNWVRHAMMALWTSKMCVRGYDWNTSKMCVRGYDWNPSKSINNWVRHAMMALWMWKMCVRGYDSSEKAERRVKTTWRSLGPKKKAQKGCSCALSSRQRSSSSGGSCSPVFRQQLWSCSSCSILTWPRT